jgi:enoyl-CoA hydratase/carnithine racemase
MSDSQDPQVITTHDGPVARITLNAPRRKNALDGNGWVQLRDALRGCEDDEQTRVVVITGAADDFCAGAAVGGPRNRQHGLRSMQQIHEAASALYSLTKPALAQVRGVAVGAGWNIALGCDVVAADTTARFCQIFGKRGLSVDFGGTWALPRIVGMQQAKRLALLADFIDAPEALSLGLITWMCEPAELDGLVTEVAGRLSLGPPIALAQTKALLNSSFDFTHQQALDAEAHAQAVNFATEDAPAARRAFQERTEPNFTGKWAVPSGSEARGTGS